MELVGNRMSENVVTVDGTWNVGRCAVVMHDLGLRHLPMVGPDGAPHGIVSDTRVFALVRRDLEQASAVSAMDPVEVTATPTDALADVIERMLERRRDVALVVNDRGALAGIFTDHDAMRVAETSLAPWRTVAETLRSDLAVCTVPLGTTAFEARERMESNHMRHLVVVDDAGKIAGMVSTRDVAGREASTLDGRMRAVTQTVEPGADLHVAVSRMVREKVGALPVAGPDRTPVGVISRTDVMRVLRDHLRAEG